mmetsp:Transcript_17979/g.32596  ORF Transcript_17979/g.32596 Transcript_17979/m.32596 type:complete len:400 (+) Transcript_17979:110-1309(+)
MYSVCVFVLRLFVFCHVCVWMCYSMKRKCLFVGKGGNTGKDLSFEEFEGSSTSGGDVGHVTGPSTEFGGGNGVSSSNNGNGSVVLGKVGKNVDNSKGSLAKGIKLKDSHGSVHNDGPACAEGLLLLGRSGGTVIKTHPSIGNGIDGHNLCVGVRGKVIGNDNINGKKNLLSKPLGLGQDLLGGLNKVVLDKGGSDIEALGLEEGEDHASSNDDLLALVEEGVKDSDLGGDLGSSNNGGHGALAVGNGSVKVLEFLGKEESRDRGGEELGDTLGGGVGTVGGSKGVVDKEVKGGSELLDESGLVLGLLLVEACVLKHNDIAFLGGTDNLGHLFSDAVGGKSDGRSEELCHAGGTGGKGELLLRAILGPSQMRAHSDNGSLLLEVLNGRDGRANTGIVRNS